MEQIVLVAQVKAIISKITGIAPETITDSAAFVDDLSLDSLATLEIAIDIENMFKIRASDEELQNIRSVQDAVSLIRQHICATDPVSTST